MLFSGVGPFGSWKLLFTVKLMIIAQVVLIVPLVISNMETHVSSIIGPIQETAQGLQLSHFKTFFAADERKHLPNFFHLFTGLCKSSSGSRGGLHGGRRHCMEDQCYDHGHYALYQSRGLFPGNSLRFDPDGHLYVHQRIDYPCAKEAKQVITPPAKKSYNRRLVLDLPPLPLEAGHITAVIGANGSGKTTFARLLAGIILRIPGAASTGRDRVGYLPQHPYAFHMRVQKNILLSKADRERCQQLMAALQIQHLAKQQAPKLSGGETARMALARLLMQSFDLLILDEPTASMDIASTILAET